VVPRQEGDFRVRTTFKTRTRTGGERTEDVMGTVCSTAEAAQSMCEQVEAACRTLGIPCVVRTAA
jgi:hypothetical protein